MTTRLDSAVLGDNRTIAAIATAQGRGALSLIRVSGPDARGLAETLLSPAPVQHRHVVHCTVRDETGEIIDDVLATLFLAPHSFTGEDVLEITTHGGLIAPAAVLAALLQRGAREATPGEFTRRAVLNGKLDLLQAEAIGDLIDARTSAGHYQALRQLDGGLSRRIGILRERLLNLEALLAYDIDFPEEDDGPIPRIRIEETTQELLGALDQLLATKEQGTLVHEGAIVVFAGAPNVGKSSLFNALLGEARAIVTEIPGTTRDAIEAVLDLPGWPLRLVDTAGLRESSDHLEQLGMETSSRYLARAAVVLACVEAGDSALRHDAIERVRNITAAPVITVATKADLRGQDNDSRDVDITVSAHSGVGLQSLLALIQRRLSDVRGTLTLDAPILTRTRHHAAVGVAREELQQFAVAWREDLLPASVAATHVHAAVAALNDLIGDVDVDDVLDVVFRSFCVGK